MLELHRKILGDKLRNRAFHAALKKVIKPGKSVVADIGAGTGYLSFLAEKLGAKQCWLFESSPVLGLAEEIAKLSGISKCVFVHGHSGHIPESVGADVLVSETLGNEALEEGILSSIDDGKRFLKKNGIIIPGKIDRFVAPVTSPRLQKTIDVWNDIEGGLDFSPARNVSVQNMYVRTVMPKDALMKSAVKWDTIDLRKKNALVRTGTIEWKTSKPAQVYGFALWWEAELVPGIRLSTSPAAPKTHWEQIYIPLLAPLPCVRGGTLQLRLLSDVRPDEGPRLVWEVEARDAKKKLLGHVEMDSNNGLM